MFVVGIIVGIMGLAVGIYSLHISQRLKADAKVVMYLNAASMFCLAAYMLTHYLEGNSHGGASVVFMLLTVRLISDSIAYALFTLLKTIWLFEGKSPLVLKKIVIGVQLGEALAFLGCGIGMWVNLAADDYGGFSDAMAAFVFILSVHYVILLWCTFSPTRDVIAAIEKMSSNGDQSRGLKKARALVVKLKRYRRDGSILGVAIVMTCVVVPFMQWIFNVIPVLFFFYVVILFQFPLLGLIQALLAAPPKMLSALIDVDKGSKPSTGHSSKLGPGTNGTGTVTGVVSISVLPANISAAI